MSRTYRKFIVKTTAGGDNTKFYRCRRRKIKNEGRMQLRRLMANFNTAEVSDMWEEPHIPMRDEWAEPTDGHCGLSKKDLEILFKIVGRYDNVAVSVIIGPYDLAVLYGGIRLVIYVQVFHLSTP